MIGPISDSTEGAPLVMLGGQDDTTDAERAALDTLARQAALMGYADDPELMGAFLKKLIGRIRSRVKARIAARRASGQPGPMDQGFTASGPFGAASISRQGIQIVPPQEFQEATAPEGGILDTIKRNPMIAIVPAAAIVAILLMRRK